jgi:adenine-specific DNA-methyltransferase
MPIQYIPYYPEPIQGQAILNNFTRTQRALKYRDNDKVFTRILRGMPLYEMEGVETVGKNPNGNLVIRGECVSACAYLKQQGIKVDLVYIDPPFASGADYAKKIYLRRNPKVAQAIEQAEQEMEDDERGFEEKMYGDIWNKEAYLNWMYENLHAIKSVMSETGNIYVHLDWHIGHYVKVLMDEVFGEDNFRNEIIWKRSSIATNVSAQWRNSHDVLLFYGKGDEAVFHIQYTEYSESSKEHFSNKDEKGVYSLVPLLGSGRTINGESGEVWHGINPNKLGKTGMHWLKKPSVLEELNRQGLIYWPKKKNGLPRLKYYLEDSKGRYVSDIWDDITVINSMAEEALGYPTQKPEDLLKRIIESGSDKDMVVADFFGGSGVTAKVAHDLGRTFIHADVGSNSIQTVRDRLKAAKASFEILEVKDGIALFRNPAQTMDKLFGLIPGLGKVDGLDGFWAGGIYDSKKGLIPVFLPNLLDHTQKILDIPLLNRILNEALPDLPDEVNQAIVYFVDMEDPKELEKFIQEYNPTEIKVELRDLKEVLHEIVTNDEVEYKVSKGKESTTIEFTRFYSDRLMQKIDSYNQKRGLNGNGKKKQIELDEVNGDEDEENGNHTAFKPIEVSENGLELIELVSLDCTSAKGKWNSDKEIKIDKKGFVIRDGEKTKEFWGGKITSKEKPLRLKVRNIAGDESIILL